MDGRPWASAMTKGDLRVALFFARGNRAARGRVAYRPLRRNHACICHGAVGNVTAQDCCSLLRESRIEARGKSS